MLVDYCVILCKVQYFLTEASEVNMLLFFLQVASLKEFCHNYILEHAEEVSETEGFKSLSCFPELLMNIIARLALKRSDIAPHGE